MTMAEPVAKELAAIKKDLAFIKRVISEEGDLSEQAKRALERARKTPRSEYVEL